MSKVILIVITRRYHCFLFSGQNRNHKSDSLKVMRRLQLSVVIFLCSWFISQSAASFFFAIGLRGETLNFLVANVVRITVCLQTPKHSTVLLRSTLLLTNILRDHLDFQRVPPPLPKRLVLETRRFP